MDRSHREPRRALVAATVSVAATHSVEAKVCSAKEAERLLVKGPLLATAPVRSAWERARTAEMLSAAPGSSSAELSAFVPACHTQPPGQLPTLMRPLTNL